MSELFKVNNACASGSSALLQCKQLVQGGIYDVALALGNFFFREIIPYQILRIVPLDSLQKYSELNFSLS